MLKELVQAGIVAVDAVVVVVAAQFGVQLIEHLVQAGTAFLLAPVGELLERVVQFLARGAALDLRLAFTVSPPAKLKPQKVEARLAEVVALTDWAFLLVLSVSLPVTDRGRTHVPAQELTGPPKFLMLLSTHTTPLIDPGRPSENSP